MIEVIYFYFMGITIETSEGRVWDGKRRRRWTAAAWPLIVAAAKLLSRSAAGELSAS